jgi:hypothetical protein
MHPAPQHVKAHIPKIKSARQKIRDAARAAARRALAHMRETEPYGGIK